MDYLIPEGRLEKTKIPFAAVAANIVDGQQVTFTRGDLKAAVSASATIPGFLPPYEHGGYLLVDGSVVCPTPVETAIELGATLVIAVDVGQSLNDNPALENVINVMFQTNHMTARHFNLHLLKKADVIIRPNVGLIHWSEFKLLHYLVKEGERAAEEALPKIQSLMKEKSGFWKRLRKAV
jgi:NTE family protein